MALTSAVQYKWAWGASEFFVITKTTGDASYPATGYPLPASAFTLNTFAATSDAQLQTPSPYAVGIWADGQVGTYGIIDPSTGNLRLAVSSTGVEVGTGVSVSTIVTALCAFGH